MANCSCSSTHVDSDSEEENNKKVTGSQKRHPSNCLPDEDDRPEEVGTG